MMNIFTEEGGTEEQTVTSEEGGKCCLSDDIILRLGHIGVKVTYRLWNYINIKMCIVLHVF